MDSLNLLITEKSKNLDEYLNNVYFNVKNKVNKVNRKFSKTKIYNIKYLIIILKRYKEKYFLIKKIIYLDKINRNNKEVEKSKATQKFDLKLEDIEAIKIFINQIEEKEGKIIVLTKDLNELQLENLNLKDNIGKKIEYISELENNLVETKENDSHLLQNIKEKETEITDLKQKNINLEQNIFELEGIKKIQYESIYNLKEVISKQSSKINLLKENYKILVDEFNLIMKKIN